MLLIYANICNTTLVGKEKNACLNYTYKICIENSYDETAADIPMLQSLKKKLPTSNLIPKRDLNVWRNYSNDF